jgi:uncharacterized membrane protein YgdD (TMEM256/DUF423 family)
MSRWLFRIAALYLLAGVALGMFMAATHNHAETPLHAHMNLLGFATLALAALWYRLQPEAADTMLAKAHFVLHNAGLPVMSGGLYFLLQGDAAAEPVVAAGSTAVVVGILCFVLNVWRLTGSAWNRAPLVSAER